MECPILHQSICRSPFTLTNIMIQALLLVGVLKGWVWFGAYYYIDISNRLLNGWTNIA